MDHLSMLTRYQQPGMNRGRYRTQRHHHRQQKRIANEKGKQRGITDVYAGAYVVFEIVNTFLSCQNTTPLVSP